MHKIWRKANPKPLLGSSRKEGEKMLEEPARNEEQNDPFLSHSMPYILLGKYWINCIIKPCGFFSLVALNSNLFPLVHMSKMWWCYQKYLTNPELSSIAIVLYAEQGKVNGRGEIPTRALHFSHAKSYRDSRLQRPWRLASLGRCMFPRPAM